MANVRTLWPYTRRTLRKVLEWVVTAFIGIPILTGLGLMGYERIRRISQPLNKRFPVAPPQVGHVDQNETIVYTFGRDLYIAMLDDIAKAQEKIYFESFIWKGDHTGQLFKDALTAAADRGVLVYVVYDGFANLVVPRKFFKFDSRLHVLEFPWVHTSRWVGPIRSSGRDHRKIMVVDDQVGYVGGYNIGDVYTTKWRDTHLRLTGPAVWELSNAFVDFWNRWRTPELPILDVRGADRWRPTLRASRNSPAELRFPIRNIYLDALERAVNHALITQPYFIPDHDIREALLGAAARGVDVRILVPERSNHVVADWLARGHYAGLLRGGVRIFLYQGAMIHAKTATVDGIWSTIGTANIDRLSLTGNYEINMEIISAPMARTLDEIFQMDLSQSRELTLEEWDKRSIFARLGERAVAPLGPLL
ncbi:MAG: phospholipase D-like domain-containing protein [Cellulomonadaceae bacterium]|jgi:cardiolipin synthase|nr:phospholipase D-like domain-containing protein [Cellulomonadaceae bacterium]